MNERISPLNPSLSPRHLCRRWLTALAVGIGVSAVASCTVEEDDFGLETEDDAEATSNRAWFQTLHGLQEHSYVERDGMFIVEGDIVVGPPISDEEATASFRGASVLQSATLWPNGEIDFEISAGFSPAQEADIYAAIAHWEQRTPIRFTEQANANVRFSFNADPSTCNSLQGQSTLIQHEFVPQDVNLGSNCSRGDIIHEIGHLVGLEHEHNRTDREDYITLLYPLESLEEPCQHAFTIKTTGVRRDLGSYDYDSIMHYGPTTCQATPMFERNDGLPFVRNADWLSQGDREAVMELYAEELGYGFEPAARWNWNWSVGDGWLVADHPRMLADVTGEGRADLVGFHEDGVWVSKSNGSTFRPKQLWLDGAFGHGPAGGGWDPVQHPRVLVDVNADGRADIVGFAEDGVWISEAEPGGFTEPHFAGALYGGSVATGGWDSTRHIREVRDLEGDGYVEVIGFGETGVWVTTLWPTTWDGEFGHDYEFGIPDQWIAGYGAGVAGGGWVLGTHPRLLGDVDGDGREDIVGFGQAGVHVALHDGPYVGFVDAGTLGYDYSAADHFTAAQGWTAGHPRALADVNGDGRDDIIGFGAAGVVVSVSRGAYFSAPQLWTPAYVTTPPFSVADGRVADMNGDGRADLIGFGASGIFVNESETWWDPPATEWGFPPLWSLDFATPSGTLPAQHLRLLGDVDGDGSADIVQIDDTQVNVIVND